MLMGISPYPKHIFYKFASMYKNLLVRYQKIFQNVIIVNEYPKSGGSWLCQMLSDILGIPFRPHQFFSPKSCIIHGHYPYKPDLRNVILVIRDGRDVMVSYYYHCFFLHEKGYNCLEVRRHTSRMNFSDINDVQQNMPRFIEYSFNGMEFPPFTWKSFMAQWLGTSHPFVRYEDLSERTPEVLENLVTSTFGVNVQRDVIRGVVNRYSFKRMAGRIPGQEDKSSFLRKGVVGDWKTKFTKEAREIFDYYAGDTLIELGYEQDRMWVSTEPEMDATL